MAWTDAIDAEQSFLIEVFKITLDDSTVKYWTTFVKSVTYDSNAYTSVPGMKRTTNKQVTDFGVGTVTIEIPVDDTYIDWDDITNDRLLDNATIEITQLDYQDFLDNGSFSNTRVIFKGEYAGHRNDVMVGRIDFKNIFNTRRRVIPKRAFSQSCPHRLTDDNCGLTLNDIKQAETIQAGATTTVLPVAGTYAVNYFQGGYLEITSGTYDGEKRWIVESAASSVTIIRPLAGAPSNGDTVDLYPHCKQTYSGCDAFSNTDNFMGFQYMPMQEEIYSG